MFRKLIILILVISFSIVNAQEKIYDSANINAATFNIKWLGYSKTRDNIGIAKMFSKNNIDLVFIQELVAPPISFIFSDKTVNADEEVKDFFEAMENEGYSFILSNEDTGTGDNIHKNSSATEWFVAFYKENTLEILNKGFIADDRSNNLDYERVPYFFKFKTNKGMDFVIISTHLKPGNKIKDRERRYHELKSIFSWINIQTENDTERDYIILGDMNVYDCETLDKDLLNGFIRANKQCLNSNLKRTEPFDQVLYSDKYTKIYDYKVLDMYQEFNIPIETSNKYVISKYSDHHPIFFHIVNEEDDD